MSYKESKMTLDKIREDYGCKGEIIFRTALLDVVQYGSDTFVDDWSYQHRLDAINEKHDAAETEGKWLWITRDFEIAILECAKEISKIPAIDMLQYVQKEVWLSGEGMDYQRAIELLKKCINSFDFNYSPLDEIRNIGFEDDEIEELGYGYLLEEEEE